MWLRLHCRMQIHALRIIIPLAILMLVALLCILIVSIVKDAWPIDPLSPSK